MNVRDEIEQYAAEEDTPVAQLSSEEFDKLISTAIKKHEAVQPPLFYVKESYLIGVETLASL